MAETLQKAVRFSNKIEEWLGGEGFFRLGNLVKHGWNPISAFSAEQELLPKEDVVGATAVDVRSRQWCVEVWDVS
ncbi:hypothetical protein [Variovorax sp. DAIF25]|uniref:hypothetical protein n=1 Tax=Variovorax sp. DAIF25 TaxID=3080983 RepID=UPI003D6B344F